MAGGEAEPQGRAWFCITRRYFHLLRCRDAARLAGVQQVPAVDLASFFFSPRGFGGFRGRKWGKAYLSVPERHDYAM